MRRKSSARGTLKKRLKGGVKKDAYVSDENSVFSWIGLFALVGLGTLATVQHLAN